MGEHVTEAVIFDLDGCLVDSEPLSLEAVASVMRDLGVTDATAEEIGSQFLGVSMKVISDYVTKRLGKPCPADFADRVEARLFDWYQTKLRRIDGADALLAQLQGQGLGLAIATGGSLKRMGITLRTVAIDGYFTDAACSADEVAKGKPAPDLFELAASRLEAKPAACVVVEDSPHGIKGAKAAGMRAIGFVGGSHLDGQRDRHADRLRAAGADVVVETLAEVAAEIL
ncbi:HAD family hydrolase [Pseudoprimorskyibacter insulae]|uniref:phosphoglycolate phosphatase n=1 Tax=Pseudoprimorskyibacter insulae TaxID=1695997 RepID=A0A2R8AX86_9RHOB|nr:HAD family phosphatase [Pseudoprimorskyibacter insulae]SPF80642.1 Phosphorylated carbohydrates phosphatase [Pseudoprimorskyibacter insulae]